MTGKVSEDTRVNAAKLPLRKQRSRKGRRFLVSAFVLLSFGVLLPSHRLTHSLAKSTRRKNTMHRQGIHWKFIEQ